MPTSLVHEVIFASFARSTHHKLALDALEHLASPAAAAWSDVLLSQHLHYLAGAKAPDDKFKDFKNHVLHVRDKFWGGAVVAAEEWYDLTLGHLRNRDWGAAAYAAGVLSHYVSDPLMPLHTGQSEAEGAVHRAIEWSVTKSYARLIDLLEDELGGYPQVEVSTGPDWLSRLICEGAQLANPYYELLIDHYDLAAGTRNPLRGMDRSAQEAIARCLGQAIIRWARVLDRVLAEAAVRPPAVSLALEGVLATLHLPIQVVTSALADQRDRRVVEAIYAEVQATGKAIDTLPEDDRAVRRMHAAEVTRVPLSTLNAEQARLPGQEFGRPATLAKMETPQRSAMQRPNSALAPTTPPAEPPRSATPTRIAVQPPVRQPSTTSPADLPQRPALQTQSVVQTPASPPLAKCHLQRESPIVDAPSIGPKTAARLQAVGIQTVADLLQADANSLAAKLGARHITHATIEAWQAQATLVCSVPGLRGHDAQLIVATGIDDALGLADASPKSLHASVRSVAQTSEGQRILREGPPPELVEVTRWIESAQRTHSTRAA